MNNNIKIPDSELKRSLNLVILAVALGISFSSVVGNPLGGAPFTGFIRTLGAGDLVYGIIMAMPVVGGILQVFVSYFLENTGKRRSIFLISGLTHRLLWIPIVLVPFFIPVSHNTFRIWSITVLIAISCAANSIVGICFWSWMGSLVPMDIRGRFFSKRTMISTATSIVAGLVVGRFLDSFPGFHGFAMVFITVAFLGASDICCFLWIKHPEMEVPKERIPFFKLFFEPFKNKNYVRLITFVTLWNFGVNFANPFFNVYMIEYLKMSYLNISLFTQVISSVSTIFFIQFWGRMADKYGNRPVSAICCTIAIALPVLWCFAIPSNYYILLLMNVFAGLAWPGLEMANANMSLGLAPEKNRSIYLANYALVTSSLGVAAAYVSGGVFMEYTKHLFESLNFPFIMGQKFTNFHALFILSGVIRLLAAYFLLPRVSEENSAPVKHVISDIFSA